MRLNVIEYMIYLRAEGKVVSPKAEMVWKDFPEKVDA